MFTDITDSIHDWYSKPFNSEGTALNWILFVGLLVIGAFLWNIGILWFFKKTGE